MENLNHVLWQALATALIAERPELADEMRNVLIKGAIATTSQAEKELFSTAILAVNVAQKSGKLTGPVIPEWPGKGGDQG